MRLAFSFPLLAAAVVLSTPVNAQDGVLVGLHATVQEGRMLCFADHHHQGESRPMPSQAAAYADAVRSWAGLTKLEYGEAWGHFEQSGSRQVRCRPRPGLGSVGWVCSLKSRPCRVNAVTHTSPPLRARMVPSAASDRVRVR